MLRFLQLMIPGTPWDLPVNAPAWARRLAQGAWGGAPTDIGGSLSETLAYAFGAGRAPADVLGWLQAVQGMGAGAVQMLQGTYVPVEERQRLEDEKRSLQRRGLVPMDPIEQPRLRYGPQPPEP